MLYVTMREQHLVTPPGKQPNYFCSTSALNTNVRQASRNGVRRRAGHTGEVPHLLAPGEVLPQIRRTGACWPARWILECVLLSPAPKASWLFTSAAAATNTAEFPMVFATDSQRLSVIAVTRFPPAIMLGKNTHT